MNFPTIADAIDRYRDGYLAARNLAPLTRRAYLGDVSELVTFLAEQLQLATIDQVQRCHLERFLAELDRRGLSGVSRARKVATIRGFFAFLVQEGVLVLPPRRSSSRQSGSAPSHACSPSPSTSGC